MGARLLPAGSGASTPDDRCFAPGAFADASDTAASPVASPRSDEPAVAPGPRPVGAEPSADATGPDEDVVDASFVLLHPAADSVRTVRHTMARIERRPPPARSYRMGHSPRHRAGTVGRAIKDPQRS